MEGKKIGQIKGQIRGEGWFSIPGYNKSSSTCIPNMSILAGMVVEKSLTKNFHQKGDGRKDGRDGRTEGRTDVNQYTPTFSKWGYNNDFWDFSLLALKYLRRRNMKYNRTSVNSYKIKSLILHLSPCQRLIHGDPDSKKTYILLSQRHNL